MTAVQALGIILAHLVGDYVLQSHWMATEKVRRWWPAVVHAVTYGLPYLVVTRSFMALAVIVGTHAVIDRYRLAKYVVWARNQIGPRSARPPMTSTGFPEDTPAWLAVWLLIFADNTMHLLINTGAVMWL
jgi:hypothetical protein